MQFQRTQNKEVFSMNFYQSLVEKRDKAIKQAREEFQRELEMLQTNCTHEDISNWTPDVFQEVRYCKRCTKWMETREKMGNFYQLTTDDKWVF